MKIALSIALTAVIIVLLCIKKLKPYRGHIVCLFGIGTIILFAVYNYKTADLILPFYHPVNQTFYQPEFVSTGEYTDALLPYIVKGKTINMYDYTMDIDSDLNNMDSWNTGTMLLADIRNILEENGATVNRMSDYPVFVTQEKVEELFENVGYLNDTFRYSYFYNNLNTEYGNGFYYYWFYSVSDEPFCLYVATEGIRESDELYMLTDKSGNWCLMSKEVFNREVL